MIGRILAAAVICGMVAATSATAGAFGIEMGTPLRDLEVIDIFTGSGTITSYDVIVPTPHPDFGIYTVSLTPQTGVCRIYAISPNFQNDRNGAGIRAAYSRVKAGLVSKYGPATEQADGLRPGARDRGAGDFAGALDRKDRSLSSRWIVNGRTNDVMAIMLLASATDASTTALTIGYSFTNTVECEHLEAEADGAGL